MPPALPDAVDKAVGNLRIHVARPPGTTAPYRGGGLTLRLAREGEHAPRGIRLTAPVILAFVLKTLLISFALIVRTAPAIGTVTVAVLALAWLVTRREKQSRQSSWVEVDSGHIRAGDDALKVRVPLEDVADIRVGVDGALRSVFAQLKQQERVALLYGLDEVEAEAARVALIGAL